MLEAIRRNPGAVAFNAVFVVGFLSVVGRFAHEYAYVQQRYDRLLLEEVEVDIQEHVTGRRFAHDRERFHEGRDYGREIEYDYDQYGFRAESNTERRIASEEFSVALVGDSLTEGQFLPYRETLSHQLDERLEGIEVYNLGVTGVDLRDELGIVEFACPIYRPDVIVWQWFLNDYHDYYAEGMALHAAFDGKRLFFSRYLRPLLWNRIYAVGSYEEFEAIPDHTLRDLQEVRALAADHDVEIVFLMYPVPSREDQAEFDFGGYAQGEYDWFREYYALFKESAEAQGFRLIEVSVVFPDYDYMTDRWSVIPQDPHPSGYSNRRVAEYLHAYLAEQGLLPDPR